MKTYKEMLAEWARFLEKQKFARYDENDWRNEESDKARLVFRKNQCGATKMLEKLRNDQLETLIRALRELPDWIHPELAAL